MLPLQIVDTWQVAAGILPLVLPTASVSLLCCCSCLHMFYVLVDLTRYQVPGTRYFRIRYRVPLRDVGDV